jgi:hypothetical protein
VITPSSLNNAWTSRSIRALIAHNLCTNILLGLPFLKHNKIIIDHDLDTAIAKDSGFDLLHENRPSSLTTPQSPRLSPKQKRDTVLQTRRHVLEELKWQCAARGKLLDENHTTLTLPLQNYIASINNTIKQLALKQELLTLETNLKEEFHQIFKPIPHINQLPDHEPARILLKDK